MTAPEGTASLVHRSARAVKWGECDFAGIAYTPRYGDWCIELIEEFYSRAGVSWQQLHSELNLGSPFVKLHLDFKSPVMLGDSLEQDLSVEQIGASSVRWAVTGRVGDREVYAASIVNVIIDKRSGRSTPIPALVRDRIEQALVASKEVMK
jgi:4-hydroxybenzoyl-CoA thioesterase